QAQPAVSFHNDEAVTFREGDPASVIRIAPSRQFGLARWGAIGSGYGLRVAVKTSSRRPRSITACRRSVQTGRLRAAVRAFGAVEKKRIRRPSGDHAGQLGPLFGGPDASNRRLLPSAPIV